MNDKKKVGWRGLSCSNLTNLAGHPVCAGGSTFLHLDSPLGTLILFAPQTNVDETAVSGS